ncbi:hypothetical protein DWB61_06970 [Ancylomarina euxinus]|uniref:DUF5683 domain-containing protein n=1 Tax=Ancylomarina euxinus TaxID=2283627 RepID=A0A425Y302_9BACT|nr:hypothetical protein DWB61_06970 [Ancylomarina euxinus]
MCFVVLVSGQNAEAQKIESDSVYTPIKVKEHSPHKATIYSAILPGLGQIYNRKYWKLPILYGGIGVTLYAIGWNTTQYNDYKNGYVDFSKFYDYRYQPEGGTLTEPTSKRYEKFLNYDLSLKNKNTDTWFKTQLKNRKDKYKRDRDLSYIILVGVYVLNIIDATVDAHFTNFNINDDLSMTVQPKMNYSPVSGSTLGLSCRINF